MNCNASFSKNQHTLRHSLPRKLLKRTGKRRRTRSTPPSLRATSWVVSFKGITDLLRTILRSTLWRFVNRRFLITPRVWHKQLAFESTEALNTLICWVLIELNSSVVNLWKCKNIKTYQINSFKDMLQSGLLQRQHPLQIKEHLRTAKLTDYVENLAGRATNSSNHM